MTVQKRPAPETSPRVWQRMLSGRRLDLLDPSPLDIEIADIAHGLARVARWNGQTSGAHIFSVAQHTLLVEAVLREQMPRAAIMPYELQTTPVGGRDYPEAPLWQKPGNAPE